MFSLLLALCIRSGPYFEAPAGSRFAKIVYGGETVLPNGRLLTPMGRRMYTQENLWRVELSPDEKTAVGIHDSGLSILDLTQDKPKQKIVGYKDGSICGCFTKDGTKFVMGGGESGDVVVYDPKTWEITKRISIKDEKHDVPFIVDLAVTKNGKIVYALDIAYQRVVTIDLEKGTATSDAKAGRQPYAIVLSPDEQHLYIANIGLFDYSLVGKPKDGEGNPRGLKFPPFGFPSKESEKGVHTEGRDVDGLGSPQVPDAQSIWRYDLGNPRKPVADKKVKTGILIHAQADRGKSVGGSAPNALAFAGAKLLVTNANNDTLQVFDQSCRLLRTVKFTPQPLLKQYRGVMPTGIAYSPSRKQIYVCATGLNAVAVIDAKTFAVAGYLPAGDWPIAVTPSEKRGTLLVANSYGVGIGPRGPKEFRQPDDERFAMPLPGPVMEDFLPGLVTEFIVPTAFVAPTQTVLRNNGLMPISRKPAFPKEITHVVFITKENHTFDGIFGELKGANGEPDYAEHGLHGWLNRKKGDETYQVMPNHIKLAEQFGISDNFYMEVGASGAGHRWLVGDYASLWTSRIYYSGWNFKAENDAKGRLISFGSNGSQIPEDYLENGSMWEHLGRNNISFRNYGEGFEFADTDEGEPFSRSGAAEKVNFPMPKVLFDNTCREFPIFNMNIPDIARVDWFKEDIDKTYRQKGKPLPQFLNVALCNDHGTRPKPEFGYPYSSSFLADNDLALGEIVEYLSHTPEWKHMAIFVTQDDAGGDYDHVDRQRSYVLCISPYAKHSYVSHVHGSIMSIIKSIYSIFNLGPNNMFDAVATPLDDMFTDKPDFTPYTHVDSDRRIFKPEATLDPDDPEFKKRRSMPSEKMDSKEWFEWLDRQRKNGSG
ncbi:MAG: bifunctional YncE family protein/alkaline phosphatase family protein [Armatimonadetes bacterium]|nr:bifunctional YncE family protein/alkaline phosphatase family protein [Armatimonadota bacterium]